MMKNKYLLLKNYIKLHCNNESYIFINKYLDELINDFELTLKRFDSLLKIHGINSKMMVINDIQALIKELDQVKDDK